MFEAAESIALSMPEADQLELIDAHPRLGAKPDEVSTFSFREQGYDREPTPDGARLAAAGDDEGTAGDGDELAATAGDEMAPDGDVATELARLNAAYEARFGFRYCVFVAGRQRSALIPGFREALEADPTAERARALRDVIAIARDRYRSTEGLG